MNNIRDQGLNTYYLVHRNVVVAVGYCYDNCS